MVRPREFDEDEAVSAAVDVFWRQGYDGTSVDDLAEALGLSRSSLYGAFGSKHALYVRALDRYREDSMPGIDALVAGPGSPLRRVQTMLESVASGERAPLGCFNVNAASECLPDDRIVARRVQLAWAVIEEALVAVLEQAEAAGELRAGAQPQALARFVLTALQGIRVVAKVDDDPRRVRDAIAGVLSALV